MFTTKSLLILALSLPAFAVPLVGLTRDSFTSEQSLDGSKAIISANRIDDIFADSGDLLIERESHLVFAVVVSDSPETGLQIEVNGVPFGLEVESDSVPAGPIEIQTISIPTAESTVLSAESLKALTSVLPPGLVSAELFGSVQILSDNLRRVTLFIRAIEIDSNAKHGSIAGVMDLLVYRPDNGEPAHFRKYIAHKCGDHKSAGQIGAARKAAKCLGSRLARFFRNFEAFLAEGSLSAYAVLAMLGASFGLLSYIAKVLISHRTHEYTQIEDHSGYCDVKERVEEKPLISEHKEDLS